jgi:RNA polymerase primary sigma factor
VNPRSEFAPLTPYLHQLAGIEVLSRDEELALTRRVRQGEVAARNELVRRNLPFVVTVVQKYMGCGVGLEDLVQAGNLGLLQATQRFDPDSGNRFLSYASWWVRAFVAAHCRENQSDVRPTRKPLKRPPDVSLDTPLGDDSSETLLDRLVDDATGAEQQYLDMEQDRQVRAVLVSLRARVGELGWEIIQARLTQARPLSRHTIGQRWGISAERVRQIEVRTRDTLKPYLEAVR